MLLAFTRSRHALPQRMQPSLYKRQKSTLAAAPLARCVGYVAAPLRAYGRIQARRPYPTQIVSALVIYFAGDQIAQRLSPASVQTTKSFAREEIPDDAGLVGPRQEYDVYRTARVLLIGGLAAVPAYEWFIWLGHSFNYSSKTLSLATKVFVNQMVFGLLFNTYFFGMQSALTGASLEEVGERIRNTVPVSWANSWKLWPAVMAFNFTFVPMQFRSIFAGTSRDCPPCERIVSNLTQAAPQLAGKHIFLW